MFLDGKIKIPGHTKPEELSKDLLHKEPEPPSLNLLTRGGTDGCHPVFPEKLVQACGSIAFMCFA